MPTQRLGHIRLSTFWDALPALVGLPSLVTLVYTLSYGDRRVISTTKLLQDVEVSEGMLDDKWLLVLHM